MAIMSDEAGTLNRWEEEARKQIEENIDEYLDKYFDPISRKPIRVEYHVRMRGVIRSSLTGRVLNRLKSQYSEPSNGWDIETVTSLDDWIFSPKADKQIVLPQE